MPDSTDIPRTESPRLNVILSSFKEPHHDATVFKLDTILLTLTEDQISQAPKEVRDWLRIHDNDGYLNKFGVQHAFPTSEIILMDGIEVNIAHYLVAEIAGTFHRLMVDAVSGGFAPQTPRLHVAPTKRTGGEA